jgi:hypothetical protein
LAYFFVITFYAALGVAKNQQIAVKLRSLPMKHRIFSLRTGLEKLVPFVNGTAPKEDCTV